MLYAHADYQVERIFGESCTASPQENDVRNLINQIFSDHEAEIKTLQEENLAETEMFNKVLKAKDDHIVELNKMVKSKSEVIKEMKEAYGLKSVAYDLAREAMEEEKVSHVKLLEPKEQ